jgi:hypothetical protein
MYASMKMVPLMILFGLQFPSFPIVKGMDLLQTPEKWGKFPGMHHFELRHMKGPITLGKESLICFDSNGHAVRLCGKKWDSAIITLWGDDADEPHTSVRVNLNPSGPNGFSLVVDLKSDREIEMERFKTLLREGVEHHCQDDKDSVHNEEPQLLAYRRHLQLPDFFQSHF